ncbi:MAG: hypothetical protein GY910_03325 [bacterium]|nr:hypothetical protein [bacterium]
MRSEAERVSTIERSQNLVRVANLLYRSEESLIDGALKRLRTALRAQDVRSKAEWIAAKGAADREMIDARRLDGLMRRGLSRGGSFGALELVVAGHDGLSVYGFAREGEAVRKTEWAPEELAGVAKALWYSDEVQRGVASSGRGVERGEVAFEAEIERPILRARSTFPSKRSRFGSGCRTCGDVSSETRRRAA